MTVSGSRLRQIGWLAVLAICVGLYLALSFRVHAVKSEVLLAERQIVALENETQLLETEFQTRSSQRQLSDWNVVEFGFAAPRADQYLVSERQLARYGEPTAPNAPAPIRVARNDQSESDLSALRSREMVSPISGEKVTLASVGVGEEPGAVFTDAFGDFLIEASPIRPAQARATPAATANAGDATE